MARPKTKEELSIAADTHFSQLMAQIDHMSENEQTASFCFIVTEKDKEAHWKRDQNIRDVLIHLYEWHQLALDWVQANRISNTSLPFLPAPYTWKSYGDMNTQFWKKHQATTYTESRRMLSESHREMIALIESFSNDELFTKAYFDWSGTTSVGSYLVSATSSHYDWAIKKIKRQIKALKSI